MAEFCRKLFGKLPVLIFLAVAKAYATDIEPRAYSNIPTGLNFLAIGYAYTKGGVAFAPSVPITNGKITIHSSYLAYVRSLDLWGRSGKLDIVIPEAWLSGQADVEGKPRYRATSGFADPLVRLYANLYGAPALSLKDFAAYRQDTILGVSLAISPPAGEYSPDKLVNIGTNRWYFKPEIGISKAFGAFIVEAAAGGFFFTENNDFYQGKSVQQAPIYAMQGHLVYSFGAGMWGALDANYYTGGRTTTNHLLDNNLQQNWRVGATLAFPLSQQHSIKLYGNTGVFARTGNNYEMVGIVWQYRWGEGL